MFSLTVAEFLQFWDLLLLLVFSTRCILFVLFWQILCRVIYQRLLNIQPHITTHTRKYQRVIKNQRGSAIPGTLWFQNMILRYWNQMLTNCTEIFRFRLRAKQKHQNAYQLSPASVAALSPDSVTGTTSSLGTAWSPESAGESTSDAAGWVTWATGFSTAIADVEAYLDCTNICTQSQKSNAETEEFDPASSS